EVRGGYFKPARKSSELLQRPESTGCRERQKSRRKVDQANGSGRTADRSHANLRNAGSVMLRFLLILSWVLFCSAICAFFLFVPPLWIAIVLLAVALLVMAWMALDCFGIHLELQQVPPSDDSDRHG